MNEANRCQTFENLPVAFMDISHLANEEFHYTNMCDVMYCAFCGDEIVSWEKGDVPFMDYQR